MALGGGSFVSQNKILPGSYINFVSAASAGAVMSERGIAAAALALDWGGDDSVIEVTNGDFQKNSLKIFGCDYTSDKLYALREMFANAVKVLVYRANSGKKAKNSVAEAKCSGVRGNDISIVISANVDDSSMFDVTTVLGGETVDKQTVSKAEELADNDFVTFTKSAELETTAGMALTGGENGEITAASHQKFLDLLEKFSFNTLCCASDDDKIKSLYVNYTKRLRDNEGKKFQTVVYNFPADYEGVINVKNNPLDEFAGEADMTYWAAGASASIPVNKSALNMRYNGELTPFVDYSQAQLEMAIAQGEFTLHAVGGDICVLNDINSLVSVSDSKGDVFKDNQTVRVCDQIANDIAVLFNTRFLGKVPNDNGGRISLWTAVVKYHNDLQDIRAIENFNDSDITVVQGDSKKSVVVNEAITIVNTMEKLYMTVTVL